MKKNPISYMGRQGELAWQARDPADYKKYRLMMLLDKIGFGFGTIRDRRELKTLTDMEEVEL